jgi:hypothetical protein
MEDHRTWAREEFVGVDLGDRRRSYRLERLAARVAEQPSGLVSEVFRDPKERQAAYDFLGNAAVRPQALLDGTAEATCKRCEGHDFVYVPVDGTTITLTDRARMKPLGSVGGRRPARGLKVVDAVAVTPDGTLQGLLNLQVWARGERDFSKSRYERRRDGDTEMRHWSAIVQAVLDTFDSYAPSVRPWFVMDREADEARLLRELIEARTAFTIRASQNRIAELQGRRTKVFPAVRRSKPIGRRVIEIPRSHGRPARQATLEIRAVQLTLLLPTYTSHDHRTAHTVGVIELRETGGRRDRLHWTLLTNRPIETFEQVEQVIDSYVMRWRVEEFHRTWKSGGCGVEDIQLQTADGIRKWAILLGTVAARTERLKHLARTQPDAPATTELTPDELAALVDYTRRMKKDSKNPHLPEAPTIKDVVLWIGEMGGYAGHYKGYQPGSKVLSRGLESLAMRAEAWAFAREAFENRAKKR